jgi:hypothetical protein
VIEHCRAEVESSRRRILAAIGSADDVTFVRLYGNIGDQLIYAGTRQLLSSLRYRELSVRKLGHVTGHTAIVAGSGGWCRAYHAVPDYLPDIENRFHRVIVLPSSFDASMELVKQRLGRTKALVFARERQSYLQIQDLCDAALAHDTAFFFDYRPYQRAGHGILNAFRSDREAGPYRLPANNNDISKTCENLDEWLWTIARSDTVQTDRAHVTIAAALLGKKVRFRPSNYHKLPAIVEYALPGFPVERIPEGGDPGASDENVEPSAAAGPGQKYGGTRCQEEDWTAKVQQAAREIAELVPCDDTFILVDDNQLGELPLAGRHAIPFLERGGLYWGPPADDRSAISDLQRLCEAQPTCIIFAWPAFWWFDYYATFHRYLRTEFACIMENERLVAFDLKRGADPAQEGKLTSRATQL